MSADPLEGRERARQEFEKAESRLMNKLGLSWQRRNSALTVHIYEPAFKVESLIPGDPSYRVHFAMGDAWKKLVEMEVERRSLEQERDAILNRVECAYNMLPSNAAGACYELRRAIYDLRAVHKGDS